MPIHADDLLRYVVTIEGRTLWTLSERKAFSVRAVPEAIEIIPASTEEPRRESLQALQRFCDEYAKKGSTTPADYRDVTFNASYLLAILDEFGRRKQVDPT